MTGPFAPSIELARLYEHTSARGTRYLVGRLGYARVVLLPGEATEDGTPTWRLLMQEAPQQPRPKAPDTSDATAGSRAASARPARQRPPQRPVEGDGRPFDDTIPI